MTELTELWCYVEGSHTVFLVSISLNHKIDNLKTAIYNKASNWFVGYGSLDLTLTANIGSAHTARVSEPSRAAWLHIRVEPIL